MPRPFALAACLLIACSGCDASSSGYRTPEPGDAVEILAEADGRPASREGYAALAAFVQRGAGRVLLVHPGSGSADPPRFVRAFRTPWANATAAQADADGYPWLAAPYAEIGNLPSFSSLVVLDPHAGVVHRVLRLPANVPGVYDLLVTPGAVLLRPYDSEIPGVIAAVDPACVHDTARCAIRTWAALGNRSIPHGRSLQTVGDTLFAFNSPYASSALRVLDLFRLSTGERIGRVDHPDMDAVVHPDAVHAFARVDGTTHVVRRDRATLALTAQARTLSGDGPSEYGLIARDGDRVYTSSDGAEWVVVRDAATLDVVTTWRTGVAAAPVFGLLAPGVLLLNGQTALDTSTGALVELGAPDFNWRSEALRLPAVSP